LKLIGEEPSALGSKWNYTVRDENRRCYAAFLASPFAPEALPLLFETVRDGINWQQPINSSGQPIPRKTAWLVKEGCECNYRYGQIEVEPQVFPAWMIELMNMTMPLFGCADQSAWPNSCNVNLYDDGGMSVGWHSDDEKLFNGKFQDIRILSLSLGQKRKFELRVNYPDEGERPHRVIVLNSGDLLTMEGMMQKHYMHRVPKEGYVDGPRINLTWRWNCKHAPRCPCLRNRR